MFVTREELTLERVARSMRRIRKEGLFEPLSNEERAESLRKILAPIKKGADWWVFGYGSLMWNPMVHFREQRHGLIYGYHRRYCFWVRSGRASPDTPSLGLGLDRGGSCRGMVFRIPGREVEQELELLWRREMISGAYIPRWQAVHTPAGLVRAIAYTANKGHKRYTDKVAPEEVARLIARAQGPRGTAREYLDNTVAHLRKLGFSDSYLSRLHELVRRENNG